MYDITKTRMLLTTAVFAAVAALSASGANARIPADTSSAGAVQESLRTGRYAAQPPSWRGKGGKGEETGGATNPLQQTGVARSGSTYIRRVARGTPCPRRRRDERPTADRRHSKRPSRRPDAAVLGAGVEGVVLTTRCRGGIALP